MTSPKKGSTRHLALAAMFAALALIFSYVEVLVPIPVPIPGVKLGLANLVILIALYRLGIRLAFSINCVRIVIAGLLFSGVFGMILFFCRRDPQHPRHVPAEKSRLFQHCRRQHGRRGRT